MQVEIDDLLKIISENENCLFSREQGKQLYRTVRNMVASKYPEAVFEGRDLKVYSALLKFRDKPLAPLEIQKALGPSMIATATTRDILKNFMKKGLVIRHEDEKPFRYQLK